MNPRLCLVLLGLAAGCGAATAKVDPTCDGAAPYAARGPYSVGVRTFTRGSTVVEVWYPSSSAPAQLEPRASYDLRDWMPAPLAAMIAAEAPTRYTMEAVRDAPLLGGSAPLPVVLFSHGLAAYRSQSSFLTAHLASWGWVVAAPDHPERGLARLVQNQVPVFNRGAETLRFTVGVLRELNAPSAEFEGRLGLDKIAVSGHSAGGGTANAVASDADVAVWVAMASGAFQASPDKPVLLLSGERDGIVPTTTVKEAFDGLSAAGSRYRELRGIGHLAFSDICSIGRSAGGIVQIALDSGIVISDFLVTLAKDGCRPDDVLPERAWPAIQHFVTSTLRSGLGIDPSPVGLDAAADACFQGLVGESLNH
ncbi:MAG: hypothetical protein U1E65_30385 [Myxococcota bacterium]